MLLCVPLCLPLVRDRETAKEPHAGFPPPGGCAWRAVFRARRAFRAFRAFRARIRISRTYRTGTNGRILVLVRGDRCVEPVRRTCAPACRAKSTGNERPAPARFRATTSFREKHNEHHAQRISPLGGRRSGRPRSRGRYGNGGCRSRGCDGRHENLSSGARRRVAPCRRRLYPTCRKAPPFTAGI